MRHRLRPVAFAVLALSSARIAAAQVWNPNVDPDHYRNPIIFADYSDPDVIRVGDDFYMTASSFNMTPALPILHSRDLVNWRIIGHAVTRLPSAAFDSVQHGNGVWAPSLRHHDGWFYIYYPDPDRGIYVVRARDIRGPWEQPVLVKAAKGWEDPCPLWDDDGDAYLVHAYVGSRAGVKSVLDVVRLSRDGLHALDDGRQVFDGHVTEPTIEGPKFYKRHGWYYIFAPAGGVTGGWQAVLRSRHVMGPYETRTVLAQGRTQVNGPHQGAWIELKNGESWFVHFQDRGAYGRITWLEPMKWNADGWPVIGSDPDGDGTGEPVLTQRKPDVGRRYPTAAPQTSDEFDGRQLGLQWQWQGNEQPGWYSLTARRGALRLYAQPDTGRMHNLWPVPSLLLQKLPAPAFVATTRVKLAARDTGTVGGLAVFGMDYAYLAVRRTATGLELVQARSIDAMEGSAEEVAPPVALTNAPVWLRVTVGEGALCRFSWSSDGAKFTDVGPPFKARQGRWVGAKVGLFAMRAPSTRPGDHADFDFFRISRQ